MPLSRSRKEPVENAVRVSPTFQPSSVAASVAMTTSIVVPSAGVPLAVVLGRAAGHVPASSVADSRRRWYASTSVTYCVFPAAPAGPSVATSSLRAAKSPGSVTAESAGSMPERAAASAAGIPFHTAAGSAAPVDGVADIDDIPVTTDVSRSRLAGVASSTR